MKQTQKKWSLFETMTPLESFTLDLFHPSLDDGDLVQRQVVLDHVGEVDREQ